MQLLFYILVAFGLIVSLVGLDIRRGAVIRSQRLDIFLLVIALVIAGINDSFLPQTIGLLLLVSSYLIYRQRFITESWIVLCGDTAVLLLSIGLGLHLVSGIAPWQMYTDITVSPGSKGIDFQANFDKGIAGLFLLNLIAARSAPALNIAAQKKYALIAAGIVMVWLLAALAGLEFQPKWPNWVYLFALNNLLFTCIAEEALFRGLIQRHLMLKLKPFRWGGGVALVVASVIFGAVHLPGGLMWAAFATLAGLVYGAAYWMTGRLSVAVLAHLSVNVGHFTLFVYPM